MKLHQRLFRKLATLLLLVCLTPMVISVDVMCQATEDSSKIAQLFQEWQLRDGAAFWGLVPELYAVLLNNPNEFYRFMSEDSSGFEDFLANLEQTVFTNRYDTAVSHLEDKRRRCLLYLGRANIDSSYRNLHKKALETLRSIRPTFSEIFFSLDAYHMSDLLRQWQLRYGVPLMEICPKLLQMALDNPNVFYEFMRTDTVQFNSWLKELQNGCFTAEEASGVPGLEKKRLEAIRRLEAASDDVQDHVLHGRLLKVMKQITATSR